MSYVERINVALAPLAPLREGNSSYAILLDIACTSMEILDAHGTKLGLTAFSLELEKHKVDHKFPTLLTHLYDVSNLVTLANLERSAV